MERIPERPGLDFGARQTEESGQIVGNIVSQLLGADSLLGGEIARMVMGRMGSRGNPSPDRQQP